MRNLKEIPTSNSAFPTKDAAYLHGQILKPLLISEPQTTLLISGGSAIEMYKILFGLHLKDALAEASIGLIDERAGEVGHANSNDQLLLESGVTELMVNAGAHLVPMLHLQRDGHVNADLIDTEYRALFLRPVIGLLGMGPDGHTAGILPTATVRKYHQLYDGEKYAVFYEVSKADSENEHTRRYTVTPYALHQISAVLLYAMGTGKREALQSLLSIYQQYHESELDDSEIRNELIEQISKYPVLELLFGTGDLYIISDQLQ